MRSFYHEEYADGRVRPRSRWPVRLARCGTVLFAFVCLLIDARMVRNAGLEGDMMQVLFRTLLLELETYLAVVVILITLRILPYRTSR